MTHSRGARAFTRVELVVVILVIAVLVSFLLPGTKRVMQGRRALLREDCVNNLKELGAAYRIWANDNGDQGPAFAPQTNGGWKELLYRTNASAYVWTNYAIMSNDFGNAPRVLLCPADERKPANSFSNLANTNISYFVGVNASDAYPQAILGGDRNLGPGTTPDPEYGFSPANGQGNVVIINGPVCWSLKIHSAGNRAGAGNILMGDGGAQQVTSSNLCGWVTNSPGLRLIFP